MHLICTTSQCRISFQYVPWRGYALQVSCKTETAASHPQWILGQMQGWTMTPYLAVHNSTFTWEMNEAKHDIFWVCMGSKLLVLLWHLEYKKLKGPSFNLSRKDLLLKAEGLYGCHKVVSGHNHKKVIAEMFVVSSEIYSILLGSLQIDWSYPKVEVYGADCKLINASSGVDQAHISESPALCLPEHAWWVTGPTSTFTQTSSWLSEWQPQGQDAKVVHSLWNWFKTSFIAVQA